MKNKFRSEWKIGNKNLKKKQSQYLVIHYRQSGWLCTRWGEIAQSLNFKYIYKGNCKSCEELWAIKGYSIVQNPQQFAGFAGTLVKIFKV
jgi:hypothetical protein